VGPSIHYYSSNHGKSWKGPFLFANFDTVGTINRTDYVVDGANWDMGYPRMVKRTDGFVLVVYYYNHALARKADPFRYIAATLFDPRVL
jgi:predicted neuraminidase